MMGCFFPLLIVGILSNAPAVICPQFSGTDCINCFSNTKNISCGWCSETKECIPGDIIGPLVGKCEKWISIPNDVCKKESSIALPNGVRYGIAIFSSLTICVTAVYWIFIFPKCFAGSLNLNPQSIIV